MCVCDCVWLHVCALFYLSENWQRFSATNGAREADERRSNQIDERQDNEEGKMEMSNSTRIGF